MFNTILVNGEDRLCFYYEKEEQVLEVNLYPKGSLYSFDLNPSRDFELIDSLLYTGEYYRFKIRFTNLNKSELLRFTFSVKDDSVISVEDILLQPLSYTTANIGKPDNELFIGEEKTFEVYSNNIDNLNASSEWIGIENYDYRFSKVDSRVFLHLVPKKLGEQTVVATLRTDKPYLNIENNLVYEVPPFLYSFNVKASRLHFLSLDRNEVTLSESTRNEGIEVQLDNSRLLSMNKTYRIEGQEEKGGALIAELFTKRRLGNNRVLCILRPYNFHRNSEGYLYIKDGDHPKFICVDRTELEFHIQSATSPGRPCPSQ